MVRLTWIIALAVVSFACSGPQEAAPVAPVIPDPAVAPDPPPTPAAMDPFAARILKFESLYGELACKENQGFDPMGAIVTLREPYGRLLTIMEENGSLPDGHQRLLEKYGFADVAKVTAEREHIQTARPDWWEALTGNLYDIVEACP